MSKKDEKKGDNDHGKDMVSIFVNTVAKQIHRGHQTVAHIKEVGGVDPSHVLEQLIDGRLVPLADNGAVTIKGGEQFFSHVRDGGAS